MEISRMGKFARDNLQNSIDAFFNLDEKLFDEVEEVEDTVNFLNHSITNQLVRLRALDLSPKDLNKLSMMTLAVADIERISDHAENIVEYAEQVRSKKATLSQIAIDELKQLSAAVMQSIDLSLSIFADEKFELIDQAELLEQKVDDMQKLIVQNHVDRLMDSKCDPLGGVVFTDMSSDLERCSDHAINIACALSDNPDY